MKKLFLTAILALTTFAIVPSALASDTVTFPFCGKDGITCAKVGIYFLDRDLEHTGWGQGDIQSTSLDRIEMSLNGSCTLSNGQTVTGAPALRVSDGSTSLVRHWHMPTGCSYHVHARHTRSVGKDSIYTFNFDLHNSGSVSHIT